MSPLTSALKSLEERLEDLQRDTKFCISNYDYHHKNNELEIITKLRTILKDSLEEGQQFLGNIENMRTSTINARKKCSEIDELLIDLGVKLEINKVEEKSYQKQQEAKDIFEENNS